MSPEDRLEARRRTKRESMRRTRGQASLKAGDRRHGTENGYTNLGCRCDQCRAAHAAHARGGSKYDRCSQGHFWTPENTYTSPNRGRECRECGKARKARHRQPRQVVCPDCKQSRMIFRPDRPDRRFLDGVCQTCANRRKADLDWSAPVEPTEDHHAFWRSRFSQSEIEEMWRGISLYLDLDFLEKEAA